jgi:hypothetical protein
MNASELFCNHHLKFSHPTAILLLRSSPHHFHLLPAAAAAAAADAPTPCPQRALKKGTGLGQTQSARSWL